VRRGRTSVLAAVCEWHLLRRGSSRRTLSTALARQPSTLGPSEFRRHRTLSCAAHCHHTTFGCANRLMHAPYLRGAGSKREHAARRLACSLQETETVRLRCDPTASQLRVFHGRPTRSCWSGAACRFTNQSPMQSGWAALLASGRVGPWLRSPAFGRRGGGEPFAADSGAGRWSALNSAHGAPLLADVPLALHYRHGTGPSCGHARSAWAYSCTGLRRTPAHICTRTGLVRATSTPGMGSPLPTFWRGFGSPLPHLRRDWAHAATPVSITHTHTRTHTCTRLHRHTRAHTHAHAHAHTHTRTL
jgi:hypothetical protein